MTRQQKRRKSEIIRALSDLSRDGWSRAHSEDWEPLEKELDAINRTNAGR